MRTSTLLIVIFALVCCSAIVLADSAVVQHAKKSYGSVSRYHKKIPFKHSYKNHFVWRTRCLKVRCLKKYTCKHWSKKCVQRKRRRLGCKIFKTYRKCNKVKKVFCTHHKRCKRPTFKWICKKRSYKKICIVKRIKLRCRTICYAPRHGHAKIVKKYTIKLRGGNKYRRYSKSYGHKTLVYSASKKGKHWNFGNKYRRYGKVKKCRKFKYIRKCFKKSYCKPKNKKKIFICKRWGFDKKCHAKKICKWSTYKKCKAYKYRRYCAKKVPICKAWKSKVYCARRR